MPNVNISCRCSETNVDVSFDLLHLGSQVQFEVNHQEIVCWNCSPGWYMNLRSDLGYWRETSFWSQKWVKLGFPFSRENNELKQWKMYQNLTQVSKNMYVPLVSALLQCFILVWFWDARSFLWIGWLSCICSASVMDVFNQIFNNKWNFSDASIQYEENAFPPAYILRIQRQCSTASSTLRYQVAPVRCQMSYPIPNEIRKTFIDLTIYS